MSTQVTIRRIQSVPFLLFVSLLTLTSAALADDYPKTAQEALKNLRHSQAFAADWSGYKPGSSVVYYQSSENKDSMFANFRDTFTFTLTDRNSSEITLDAFYVDGTEIPGYPEKHSLDMPEIAPDSAANLGDDEIIIGSHTYKALVVEFKYHGPGYYFEYKDTYWLTGNVPDGVLRHHRLETKPSDPTYKAEKDVRLTDLDTVLDAGGKKVHCYCYETEQGSRGAKFTRIRACKSREIPGSMVTAETTVLDGGKQASHVLQTVQSFKIK